MGTITLPTSGQVYFDTQSIIYSVESLSPYWSLLEPVWLAAQRESIRIASSDLALLEVLVMPYRKGDAVLTGAYEAVFQSPEFAPIGITCDVLRLAASLRATIPALRTPDAIHAASALNHHCALFISNDTDFRKVPGLPLVILKDLLGP